MSENAKYDDKCKVCGRFIIDCGSIHSFEKEYEHVNSNKKPNAPFFIEDGIDHAVIVKDTETEFARAERLSRELYFANEQLKSYHRMAASGVWVETEKYFAILADNEMLRKMRDYYFSEHPIIEENKALKKELAELKFAIKSLKT
jgi:hypothetical protein